MANGNGMLRSITATHWRRRRYVGLGDMWSSIPLPSSPTLLSWIHQAAAAPAPPVTGASYVWHHPSGFFYSQISPTGQPGGLIISQAVGGPEPATVNEDQKAVVGMVASTWAWPWVKGLYSGSHAVTGFERPDADMLAEMSHYFAFNKGQVFTAPTASNPTGVSGTNVSQVSKVQVTSPPPTPAVTVKPPTQPVLISEPVDQPMPTLPVTPAPSMPVVTPAPPQPVTVTVSSSGSSVPSHAPLVDFTTAGGGMPDSSSMPSSSSTTTPAPTAASNFLDTVTAFAKAHPVGTGLGVLVALFVLKGRGGQR